MKVLFLSMSCNVDSFVREEEVVKETWAKGILEGSFPNAEWYSYRGGADNDHIDYDNRIIYLKSSDKYDMTYQKTYDLFSFIKDKIQFDVVVRTNTSNCLNVPLILDFIQQRMDKEKVYTFEYFTTYLVSHKIMLHGNFWFMTKDMVYKVLSKKNVKGTDDSVMGSLMMDLYNGNYDEYRKHLCQCENLFYNDSMSVEDVKNKLCVNCKSEIGQKGVRADIGKRMMKTYGVMQKITNNDCKAIRLDCNRVRVFDKDKVHYMKLGDLLKTKKSKPKQSHNRDFDSCFSW